MQLLVRYHWKAIRCLIVQGESVGWTERVVAARTYFDWLDCWEISTRSKHWTSGDIKQGLRGLRLWVKNIKARKSLYRQWWQIIGVWHLRASSWLSVVV